MGRAVVSVLLLTRLPSLVVLLLRRIKPTHSILFVFWFFCLLVFCPSLAASRFTPTFWRSRSARRTLYPPAAAFALAASPRWPSGLASGSNRFLSCSTSRRKIPLRRSSAWRSYTFAIIFRTRLSPENGACPRPALTGPHNEQLPARVPKARQTQGNATLPHASATCERDAAF